LRRLATQRDQAALEQLAEEAGAFAQPAVNLVILSNALEVLGREATAERLLRQAQPLHPGDFWTNFTLARLLSPASSARDEEAIRASGEAPVVRPQGPWVHDHLVRPSARNQEGIGYYRAALAVRPQSPWAHANLAVALHKQGRFEGAEAECRRSMALRPESATAYNILGNALQAQGKLAEAGEAFRKALALRPELAEAHNNLGTVLAGQGNLAEAVEVFRKAIALKPDVPESHTNLGIALRHQGKLIESEAEHRRAIALGPSFFEAYANLGGTLLDQGRLAEAEAVDRKAIALWPDYPVGHYELGIALGAQGKHVEAEAAYRNAIALQPGYPEAHCNLADVLRSQGRFVEALAAVKRGHALGSKNTSWRYPSAQWVEHCKRLVQLDAKLPAILSGKEQAADSAERIALAELCLMPCKKRYATAAGFYSEAFAAEPIRTGDRASDARYNAACAAALAGCGQGADADTLDTAARARLRQQALDWLRAELAAWRKVLEGDRSKAAPAVRKQMQHWLQDADFAGVRGPQALARLPEAERSAWQKLWAEVEELFVQARGKTSRPKK
jgi:tetratricopeptide (TPR) repeat protein